MFTTNKMFYIIKEDLKKLEDLLYSTVNSKVNIITEIGNHLVSSGGKRIRPALFLLALRSKKHIDIEKYLPLAMSLEIIHTASLVHDDVLDNSKTRRGSITANAKWGNNIAVLAGDFLFAKAFSAIAQNDYGTRTSEILANIVCDLSEGEILQNHFGYQIPETEAIYYDRIAKKTANFIAAACELGAIHAGMDEMDIEKMKEYGYSIGLAFQIIDDILDLTSTSKKIGKTAGNDILQGVITLPIMLAYQNIEDNQREELRAIIENRHMTKEDVNRGIEIVLEGKGLEMAKAVVDKLINRAINILPETLPNEIKKSFREIALFIEKREY